MKIDARRSLDRVERRKEERPSMLCHESLWQLNNFGIERDLTVMRMKSRSLHASKYMGEVEDWRPLMRAGVKSTGGIVGPVNFAPFRGCPYDVEDIKSMSFVHCQNKHY